MQLVKLIDSTTIKACPRSGYDEGRAISNLHLYYEKNSEAALAAGYKPLTTAKPPTYDPATQYITATYKATKKAIVQSWVVKDVETNEEPTEVSLESRVAALELKFQTAEAAGGLFSAKSAETAAPAVLTTNTEEETV